MALAAALAASLAGARALALAPLHRLPSVLAILTVLASCGILAVVVGHLVYSMLRFFSERSGRPGVGAKHPGEPNLPRGVEERPRLPESVLLVEEVPEVSGGLCLGVAVSI